VKNLKHYTRVIGGYDSKTADAMYEFYKHITDGELDRTTCASAELVKTAENTFRDMQISFANVLALLSERVGASSREVIRLVNKVEGRNVLQPGAGVGGHCLPKDPYLMVLPLADDIPAAGARNMVEWSRRVNDYMPHHAASQAIDILRQRGIAPSEASVALFGVSYLANSDDTRNSPSDVIASDLRSLGVALVTQDFFVDGQAIDVLDAARGKDLLMFATEHSQYRSLDWPALAGVVRGMMVFDTRSSIDDEAARAAGFSIRRLGEALQEPGRVN